MFVYLFEGKEKNMEIENERIADRKGEKENLKEEE